MPLLLGLHVMSDRALCFLTMCTLSQCQPLAGSPTCVQEDVCSRTSYGYHTDIIRISYRRHACNRMSGRNVYCNCKSYGLLTVSCVSLLRHWPNAIVVHCQVDQNLEALWPACGTELAHPGVRPLSDFEQLERCCRGCGKPL